jgi:siroheme synthase (precorrin-2 oxidase/ferrochelatase)
MTIDQSSMLNAQFSISYPITLINLRGARVVVVGGGAVAERKVRGLLDTGAM